MYRISWNLSLGLFKGQRQGDKHSEKVVVRCCWVYSKFFFSNPTFFKTLQLNPLPIVFHLLPRRTVLISATVSPACDYDREVTTDYEIHNAPDILRGLIWDVCQGKLSLCHRLHPRSHERRPSPLFFDCSSASQNCSQLIRAVMRKGGCG